MAPLKLPMWFATERRPASESLPPCDDPGASYAFSELSSLTEFMRDKDGLAWEVSRATDREELIVAIADGHIRGNSIVCLNPEPDGTGGHRIQLFDLIEM